MEIKKRIATTAFLVISAVVVTIESMNAAPGGAHDFYALGSEVLAETEVGIVCRCSTTTGQSCAVDNTGAICAPGGADSGDT